MLVSVLRAVCSCTIIDLLFVYFCALFISCTRIGETTIAPTSTRIHLISFFFRHIFMQTKKLSRVCSASQCFSLILCRQQCINWPKSDVNKRDFADAMKNEIMCTAREREEWEASDDSEPRHDVCVVCTLYEDSRQSAFIAMMCW